MCNSNFTVTRKVHLPRSRLDFLPFFLFETDDQQANATVELIAKVIYKEGDNMPTSRGDGTTDRGEPAVSYR